ncbi:MULTISPECIES: hypothetical protein [unclassified Haladaptatus]|uniref:DUF7519 family protein n=1 Tax=unclassified Haladaptatus TaxID=2622732 RepID=UPI00209BFB00|nr:MULTISPECIES: hypothetical protein [unclassified Haladaptatus]MCO8247056.1 hypothetical protein [Haladaptatus sp. AB643]MCO8256676.1 hypothetical protein [Haladaptatus sp. AB618]
MSTVTGTTTATQRPTRVASALAVGIALLAMWELGASSLALVLELAGVAALAGGVGLWRREWLISGALVGVVGVAGVVGALAVASAGIARLSGFIRLIPGLIGVFVLALALVPVRGTGSRTLVKVGTALVFIGVLASGIFNAVTLGTLLVAGAATVVAWDAGEHAINVGEHLGRGRDTREIELVHIVGSGVVAFVAVEAAKFSGGVGPSGLSLASLVLLLVAIVLLAVALHD